MKNFSSLISISLCIMGALSSYSLPASAQAVPETGEIRTLEQCTEMALRSNAAQRNAANSAKSATELRKEAFTKYFPQVSAQGAAFTTQGYVLAFDILNILEVDLIKKGVTAGVQAIQPVFLGGQIYNGNRLAEVGEAVAMLRARQTEREIRLTTARYYWKLAVLKATRSTLTAAIGTLDTLARQVRVAVDAGLVLNNDYLKVDLRLSDYKASLEDLDNGIRLCRMLLSQYAGVSIYTPLDIEALVPRSVPEIPDSLYVNPSEALGATVDYNLLQANVKAKRLEKRIELGKYLPDVAVGAGWFYHNLLDKSHSFWAAGVGVNVPISGWWGGSHSLKRKKLELANAENELVDKGELLQIEMLNRWDELTAAHRKMQTAAKAIAQSTENLRLNREFYNAGTSTVTDLLDAETLFKESHERYASAYGDYQVAIAAYLLATARKP